ncbi:tRNA (adenosine(37)-N6)-dimethylallyltransferase MiaA [Desulfovibrio aminophilus]|uniref:tRNA (adenosine(37)-N6)-dimethylallyltransferase MiaA n=1 Tax=Desulfovibrio aminophilus TaxID=81425 RepID=UPI00040CD76E|nr:tRNA (adenosine(37)-N6)-dimethylallyltransferase MiaA [Desulfovibrio aminophilus]
MERVRVLCLAGPTGTGKTGAALAAAREIPAVVVNFDSRQVYADLPIVTAQPDAEERAVCPHRLYGFLPTAESLTAAAFAELARREVREAAGAGRLPILVGGTGLYLRAILHGLAPIPPIPAEVREAVLARLRGEGAPTLHAELTRLDPEYAARIHPNDSQRNARALEVFLATGKTLTWWHHEGSEAAPFQPLLLGLGTDVAALEPLLAARVRAMLAAGALEEVRQAFERCPDPEASGFSGIGCPELLAHLRGECGLDEAVARWIKNTRAYAKRQFTWFRAVPGLRWLTPGDDEAVLRAALEWLN